MKRSYKIILGLFLSIAIVMAIQVVSDLKTEVTRAASIEAPSVIMPKNKTASEETEDNEENIDIEESKENVSNVKRKTFDSLEEKDKYYYKELEKLYHDDKMSKDYLNFDMTTLKKKVLNEALFKNNMVLCGDSYCGLLSKYLEKRKQFKGEVNARAAHSVVDNKEIYIDTINNSDKDIVILSTSVNDVLSQTSLKDFKDTIEELFELAYKKGKLLVVHTNCDFLDKNKESVNKSLEYELLPKYYDWELIISASKYDNVIYTDCNDIVGRDHLVDGIHYDEGFYEILIDRIYHDLQGKFGF